MALASGARSRITWSRAMPSSPGWRRRSMMAKSRGISQSRARTSSAFRAVSTAYPSFSSKRERKWRMFSSSSTTRIRSFGRDSDGMAVRLQHGGPVEGQEDTDRGSEARLAPDGDGPTQLLDDAVTDGQPEPHAFARLLRGEERLEDPREILLCDTRTGVGHRNDRDPVAGGKGPPHRDPIPILGSRAILGGEG